MPKTIRIKLLKKNRQGRYFLTKIAIIQIKEKIRISISKPGENFKIKPAKNVNKTPCQKKEIKKQEDITATKAKFG